MQLNKKKVIKYKYRLKSIIHGKQLSEHIMPLKDVILQFTTELRLSLSQLGVLSICMSNSTSPNFPIKVNAAQCYCYCLALNLGKSQ